MNHALCKGNVWSFSFIKVFVLANDQIVAYIEWQVKLNSVIMFLLILWQNTRMSAGPFHLPPATNMWNSSVNSSADHEMLIWHHQDGDRIHCETGHMTGWFHPCSLTHQWSIQVLSCWAERWPGLLCFCWTFRKRSAMNAVLGNVGTWKNFY